MTPTLYLFHIHIGSQNYLLEYGTEEDENNVHELSLAALQQRIYTLLRTHAPALSDTYFTPASIHLQYEDEDNDRITLGNDGDLEHCLFGVKHSSSGGDTVHVQLYVQSSQEGAGGDEQLPLSSPRTERRSSESHDFEMVEHEQEQKQWSEDSEATAMDETVTASDAATTAAIASTEAPSESIPAVDSTSQAVSATEQAEPALEPFGTEISEQREASDSSDSESSDSDSSSDEEEPELALEEDEDAEVPVASQAELPAPQVFSKRAAFEVESPHAARSSFLHEAMQTLYDK